MLVFLEMVKQVVVLKSHLQIESGDLWIRNGKILDPQAFFYSRANSNENFADEVSNCFEDSYVQIIDAKECIVSPGFIDIQINGAYGIDFSDPEVTMDQIHTVTRNLLSVFELNGF